MVRKLVWTGGEAQSESASPPADAPGRAGGRRSSGRCGTCKGYMPFGDMVNKPELCRSPKRVSLKALISGPAAPAPRRSGTAMTGFCEPTILITTEPSCAYKSIKKPDKIAKGAMVKYFLFIVSAQTRIRSRLHFCRSPLGGEGTGRHRRWRAVPKDPEQYCRWIAPRARRKPNHRA